MPAFHGATLFSLLLNNHPRISTLSDTLPFREHLDYFCSCKRRINECEFWITLADELSAGRFVSDDYLLPMLPRLTGGAD